MMKDYDINEKFNLLAEWATTVLVMWGLFGLGALIWKHVLF